MATQFAVDLVFKSQGLGKLDKATKKLQGIDGAAIKAANGIKATGRASKAAAVGVKGLGVAFKTALGPIGAALAAIGGVTAAFNTLKTADFAAAKVKTLGVNVADLKAELKAIAPSLAGQRSQVELLSASYDVASAGFNNAADAAKVLQASSMGATGGFADLNTVANATTSVLNAYGLSADKAGALVDRFIQTQNDGKIVVSEYADNIGKVASAAAGLSIPLEEVNAVIAQSTASGVQAEVAFTGLKSALARFASGEAAKALKDVGVNIDAATLASDGLVGTFKKLKDAGLDTGQIFKALGTEAAPALLPVLNNLEKFEELLENQKNSAGASAEAQKTAADTIQGAWNQVATAVSDLFSDQAELGVAIKVTLQATAAVINVVAKAVNILGDTFRALFGKAQEAGQKINQVFEGVGNFFSKVGEFMSQTWQVRLGEIVLNAAQGSPLVQKALGAIGQFWEKMVNSMGKIWQTFISYAINALAGLIAPLTPVLKLAGIDIGKSITGAVASAFSGGSVSTGVISPGGGQLNAPSGLQTVNGAGGGGAGGGGRGGRGGGRGGGGVDTAAKEAEIAERQLKAAQDRLFAAEQLLEKKQELTKLEEIELKRSQEIANIQREYSDLISKVKSVEEEAILEKARGLEIAAAELEAETAIKEMRESATKSITDEIEMLQARLNGTEDVLKAEREIARLRGQGVDGAQAQALVQTRNQLKAQAEATDKAKQSAEALAGSISSALTDSLRGLIDGSMSAEEALSNAFKKIGDAFLDMAMQMIQEWIKMQLIGLVGSFFGGAAGGTAGGGGFGAGAFNLSGGQFGAFAEGGYVTSPTVGLVGEGGESEYVIPSSKMSTAMARYSKGARGSSVLADSGVAGGDSNETPTFRLETTVINGVEYATVEQVRAMGQQAARQGAAAGTARTMSSLKNNRSSRSRLGM